MVGWAAAAAHAWERVVLESERGREPGGRLSNHKISGSMLGLSRPVGRPGGRVMVGWGFRYGVDAASVQAARHARPWALRSR